MYIHSEEMADVQYVQNRVRIKVKAIGSLSTQQPSPNGEDSGFQTQTTPMDVSEVSC